MTRRTIIHLLLVATAMSTLPACRSTTAWRGHPEASDAPPPTPRTQIAGRSVENRPIEYRVWGHSAPRVMIIASVHGDEPAGTPLVEQLELRLASDPSLTTGRSVIVVPIANPDGYEASRRTNARGIDLNRNFPTDSFRAAHLHGEAPLSEPESRALYGLVNALRPDRIVSIHQPLRCIDYDGPARTLAERMSRAGDLPVRKLGARPGSFGSFAGVDQGIPTITLELPGGAHRRTPEAIWESYGPMLLAAIEG